MHREDLPVHDGRPVVSASSSAFDADISDIQNELYAAVTDCADRCLPYAAKWAAMLLTELSRTDEIQTPLADLSSVDYIRSKFGVLPAPMDVLTASSKESWQAEGRREPSTHPSRTNVTPGGNHLLPAVDEDNSELSTSKAAEHGKDAASSADRTNQGDFSQFGLDVSDILLAPAPATPMFAGSLSKDTAKDMKAEADSNPRALKSFTQSSLPQDEYTSPATRSVHLLVSSGRAPRSSFVPRPRPPIDERALLAKSLFELREYARACDVLSPSPHSVEQRMARISGASPFNAKSSQSAGQLSGASTVDSKDATTARRALLSTVASVEESSPLILFLRMYLAYLAGEKKKEDIAAEKTDANQKAQVTNEELPRLLRELTALRSLGLADGFLLYLLGLVLHSLEKRELAMEALVESVNAYPCNWSAWQLLAQCCQTRRELRSLRIRPHWIARFFFVEALLELPDGDPETDELFPLLSSLTDAFPTSTYVLAQTAQAHYKRKDMEQAQCTFERLRTIDPYRLEGMDSYSNALFVRGQRTALAALAHAATRIDKYRPETCCIIGNYFSLRGEHARALQYYWRALQLAPKYSSAWTLMGHEHVEMRSHAAAVECYRRAVAIQPKDYRAWYGLGQAFEILGMNAFALYYFRRAAACRPYDPRMWCAVGAVLDKQQRIKEAISAYKRAVANDEREGIAYFKLMQLYLKQKETDAAAECAEKALEQRGEDVSTADALVIDALLFLAEYYKSTRQIEKLESTVSQLMEAGGTVKEKARKLLAELAAIKQAMGISSEPTAFLASSVQRAEC